MTSEEEKTTSKVKTKETIFKFGDSDLSQGPKIRVDKAFQERPDVKERYKEIITSKTLTEEEVQLGQYETLLDTVTRLDRQEWSTEFQKSWMDAGGSIAKDFTKEILTGKLPEQIARLETGERLKNDESLPISYSNCDFLNLMERARPRLMGLASTHFHRVEVGVLDPEFVHPVDQKFSNDDALNINLTDDIKRSKEYLSLKAVMRNAVFEPMVYEDAVANAQQVFQLKKRELNLRGRELEEDAMRIGLIERPRIMPPVEEENKEEKEADGCVEEKDPVAEKILKRKLNVHDASLGLDTKRPSFSTSTIA